MSYSGGAYQFQKDRRRADSPVAGKIPITGFGPNSDYTFWLVSPIATRQIKFKNGKPYLATIGQAITDPNLIALREKVVRCIKPVIPDDGPCLLIADIVLMEYAAALLLADYNLNDDELEMLLPSGSRNAKWINAVATHAIGGEDALKEFAKINPEALANHLTLQTGTPVPSPAANPVPPAIGQELNID